ncbi:PRTRC system protein E [Chryseobacterium wanjuense]|uniref:PRTRC system protein E n=1 Tax=Chryseobacterium wanjuense TaxID=356305 RepID=A0A1I0QCX1_9FLAO|nr:PRTRC system protein E [Chryseobacterium wanjuense]SEW24738.1 PRTRC system protein E [Chryseobacterium wanjuense]
MNTQFFNQIGEMNLNGTILLTIAKGVENNLIVSVTLQNDGCGDDAKNIIPPLTLKGTADELDSGFFERITTPLQTTSGLLDNMEEYMKKLDETRKNSAMEKEKTDKEKKVQDDKEKKYKEAMSKADALEKEGKYKEAWTALPKTSEYPDHAEIIRKRQNDFARKFAPSFFDQETAE